MANLPSRGATGKWAEWISHPGSAASVQSITAMRWWRRMSPTGLGHPGKIKVVRIPDLADGKHEDQPELYSL